MLKNLAVILTVGVAVSLTASACKKKSKHKGGNEVVRKDDNKKLDDQYGREITEGNTRIFRGTDKIFWIKADPYSINVNQTVQFEGACGPDNAGKLNWNFGDQIAGAAPVVTAFKASHAYTKIGSYKVIGECDHSGQKQTGTLTIEVIAQGGGNGGGGTIIDPGQNSPIQNGPAPQGGTIPGGSTGSQPGYFPR
jgi:hypothetical protein